MSTERGEIRRAVAVASLAITTGWMGVLPAATTAQEESGRITGRIFDARTAQPLAAAQIIVENTIIGTLSSVDGRYIIRDAPTGTQSVVVQLLGYGTKTLTGVTVEPGGVATLDVGLFERSLGVLGSITYFVYNRLMDDEARVYEGFNLDTGSDQRNYRLRYLAQTLVNAQLKGEHRLGFLNDASFDWRGAWSQAGRYEPNTREVLYREEGGRFPLRQLRLVRFGLSPGLGGRRLEQRGRSRHSVHGGRPGGGHRARRLLQRQGTQRLHPSLPLSPEPRRGGWTTTCASAIPTDSSTPRPLIRMDLNWSKPPSGPTTTTLRRTSTPVTR